MCIEIMYLQLYVQMRVFFLNFVGINKIITVKCISPPKYMIYKIVPLNVIEFYAMSKSK